jgi:hypothetical protein
LHTASSYLADGQQAYYLLRAGDLEEWYTDAERALKAYEETEGATDLFVKRAGTMELKKVR